MANLTTTEANNILNATSGQAAFAAVSGGVNTQKVALNIQPTASTAAAQGTEASGGGYVRTNISFSAASAGSITNSGPVTFTNMPACVVTGVDEFDANATTRRWFGGLASGNKTVNAGDTFTINTSAYTKTLS